MEKEQELFGEYEIKRCIQCLIGAKGYYDTVQYYDTKAQGDEANTEDIEARDNKLSMYKVLREEVKERAQTSENIGKIIEYMDEHDKKTEESESLKEFLKDQLEIMRNELEAEEQQKKRVELEKSGIVIEDLEKDKKG